MLAQPGKDFGSRQETVFLQAPSRSEGAFGTARAYSRVGRSSGVLLYVDGSMGDIALSCTTSTSIVGALIVDFRRASFLSQASRVAMDVILVIG